MVRKFIGDTAADLLGYVMPRAGRGSWHPKTAALTQVFAAVSDKLKKKKYRLRGRSSETAKAHRG
eukprot:TRINITY_DN7578_c0_g1_i1.p2 TRINITY_DN7578_c0_g1~~TRINITY_DN7578_c0_g1_i1.p2  ORF type:complete len:65 (+),score=30.18 TRINITY_DN7578_c0_g1_i1:271-465(+)